VRRRAVLHGDAGFGVHVHRHADGHWFVEKFLAHSDGFKGGHVKGQQALELHLKQRANVAAPRTKASNPHHRTCSFEAKHFGPIVAAVLGDNLKGIRRAAIFTAPRRRRNLNPNRSLSLSAVDESLLRRL
jgi:hypothetical protein